MRTTLLALGIVAVGLLAVWAVVDRRVGLPPVSPGVEQICVCPGTITVGHFWEQVLFCSRRRPHGVTNAFWTDAPRPICSRRYRLCPRPKPARKSSPNSLHTSTDDSDGNAERSLSTSA